MNEDFGITLLIVIVKSDLTNADLVEKALVQRPIKDTMRELSKAAKRGSVLNTLNKFSNLKMASIAFMSLGPHYKYCTRFEGHLKLLLDTKKVTDRINIMNPKYHIDSIYTNS